MKQFYLLETIDPIILSSNNSSTNNHECLDYIPGSSVLGLIASRLYKELTSEQSWQLFHDGSFRFGPCYPVVNNSISLPLPASWHGTKLSPAIESGRLNSSVITNHSSVDFRRDEQTQYKQCRTGFINSDGVIASVKQGSVTKSAIDRTTGKAKDQALFSYSFIESNQFFIGWFDSESPEDLGLVSNNIQGFHRIGRSRNSEFGRVNVTLLNDVCLPEENYKADNDRLVLWCLSDVEIIDRHGIATYTPKAEDIHPKLRGSLNTEQSFIRTLKVSRFNQTRQGYDNEQLLIQKGSVLVFDSLEPPVSEEILSRISEQGIGINKQQGLGWVQVNPAWADSYQVSNVFDSIEISLSQPDTASQALVATPESSSLIAWIEGANAQSKTEQEQKDRVDQLLICISKAYTDARSYNNIRTQHEAGPSATQWRRIFEIIKNGDTSWKSKLFEGDSAICKAKNDEFGWGIQFVNDISGRPTNFADCLRELICKESIPTLRKFLEILCRYDLSVHQDHKKFKEKELLVRASTKLTEDHA